MACGPAGAAAPKAAGDEAELSIVFSTAAPGRSAAAAGAPEPASAAPAAAPPHNSTAAAPIATPRRRRRLPLAAVRPSEPSERRPGRLSRHPRPPRAAACTARPAARAAAWPLRAAGLRVAVTGQGFKLLSGPFAESPPDGGYMLSMR